MCVCVCVCVCVFICVCVLVRLCERKRKREKERERDTDSSSLPRHIHTQGLIETKDTNNGFAVTRSSSKEGSYLRLIDFLYHSTLGQE